VITVLFPPTPFIPLYSGLPFFLYPDRTMFRFTSDPGTLGDRDPNRIIILLRWISNKNPQNPKDPRAFLEALRGHYQKVIFYDDDDSTASTQWELLPLVDFFWKKQLLKDRDQYLRAFAGNRAFTHYYHELTHPGEALGTTAPVIEDPTQLAKLRVTWNLGIGLYPLSHKKDLLTGSLYPLLGGLVPRTLVSVPPRKTRSFFDQKQPFCQARYATKGYTPLVGYQRELFSRLVEGRGQFRHGFIDRRAYSQELAQAQAVLSPFGWGEVCYRDFEAFQGGTVLIKPDMSTIDTWPDCYRPGETYVPLAWDGSDLFDRVDQVLTDGDNSRRMATRGFEFWADSMGRTTQRLETLLEEIL